MQNIGNLPLESSASKKPDEPEEKKTITKTVIQEDGSYKTETMSVSSSQANQNIFNFWKCL